MDESRRAGRNKGRGIESECEQHLPPVHELKNALGVFREDNLVEIVPDRALVYDLPLSQRLAVLLLLSAINHPMSKKR